jgi:hypothetical protein
MIRRLIIGNAHEYYFPAPELLPEARVSAHREVDFSLSERALFWGGDDKLVVLPRPATGAFQAMIREVLGYRSMDILVPRNTSDSICNDLYRDPENWSALLQRLGDARTVEVFAFGITPQLYQLISRLRLAGLTVNTPELPPEPVAPVIERLDSKSGFRELTQRLAQAHPEMAMPRGVVCRDTGEIAQAIEAIGRTGASVMLKSDSGAGGEGMVKLDGPFDPPDIEAAIAQLMRETYSVQSFPVVAEQYIPPLDSPTAQALVLPDGRVRPLLCGRQILEGYTKYMGIEAGPHVYSEETRQGLYRVLSAIGTELARVGYQGWFDVDFVRGRDNRLYVLEVNIRRTGVSHVWEILERLGAGEDSYISEGWLEVRSSSVDWDAIAARLGTPRQDTGIAFLTTSYLRAGTPPSVGYCAWSPTLDGLARQLARLEAAVG